MQIYKEYAVEETTNMYRDNTVLNPTESKVFVVIQPTKENISRESKCYPYS